MRAYKNFWSLNTDEAVVAGILRDETSENVEVLMPLNAQMKDIDLTCVNLNTKNIKTVQVKGSKAYEPNKNHVEKFGDGSFGWFGFPKKNIDKSTANYFIFLVYVIEQKYSTGRRTIEPHTITIPTNEIKKLVKEYKSLQGSKYHFYFWVNPKNKTAFDWRNKEKDLQYDVSKYLDEKGFDILNESLG